MGENQNAERDDLGVELAAAEEPKRFPWEDPKWEGHQHTWPTELPDDPDAVVECEECGHPVRVDLIRADG